ncbi:dihydrolipoamide acetyltransferase family protein [Gryllotalpicola daejeonensis]|uniref:Dihydrolipoamide acetyltransferase component of pyruvate dehydrogenase complex n=1 Tax=Gryllotalpicola daejeonensis TaxID=993087 RepID=A0ABP7ZHM4_9MICO
MPEQFLLPDLGEGLTEAEVTNWLVQPGETVAIDQPVVEVESAKSIVELPCPFAGTVGELCAHVGDVVHAGQPLLRMAEHEVIEDAEAPASSGAVLVGYGVSEPAPVRQRTRGARFGRGRATASAPAAVAPGAAAASTLIDPTRRSRVVSPIVRRIAQEAGFDAAHLVGSGPDGLVVKSDVEAAIAAMKPQQQASAPASASAQSQGDPDVRIPITGIREIIGTRLTRSRQTIPEATIWLDVDATPLIEAKKRLEVATGDHYSLTAVLARFTVAALKKFPALNSSVDEDAHVIVQHSAINLGIAAQTPRGLLVPVVHGAHELSTAELRDRVAELTEHAKKGDFPPAQLTGSTFTLDNYGGFGIDGGAPIINPPEVAILGVGRLVDRPWVVDGELAVRKVMTLTLVFDHRVCDGDVASGFLTRVAACIEEPLLAL